MKTKKILQSGSILLLLVITFALLQQVLAQDEDDTGDDATTETSGVSGIADTADNFNVSPIPTQEEVTPLVNLPATQTNTLDFSKLDLGGVNLGQVTQVFASQASRFMRKQIITTPNSDKFRKQTGDIIYETSDEYGNVLTVFPDYSLVITTAEEQKIFHGYVYLNSAGRLILVGTDTVGNQLTWDNGYLIALTVDGDVLMGTSDHQYFYDYDEDGKFLALSDSDGNEYIVEFDADGSFTITDADGNIGEFNSDGSYVIYDENGNILEEGDWLPDDEVDEASFFGDDEDGDDGSSDDSDDDTNGSNGWGDDGGGDESSDDSGDDE